MADAWDEFTPVQPAAPRDPWDEFTPGGAYAKELPVSRGEAALRALSSIGTAGFGTKTLGLRPASRMGGFADQGTLPQGQKRQGLVRAEQQRDADALKQHPWISLAVGAPAAAASMPVALAARAPTLGGRLIQAMKAGAGYGAAGGLGRAQSAADVPGNVAGDALLGAAAAPFAQAGGELLGAGLNAWRSRLAPWLSEVAIDRGRKVLTGNSAPMATRKPLSEEAIRAAYGAGAIRPLGTTEKAAEVLGSAREAAGQRYADVIDALKAAGVEGPDPTALGVSLLQEADDVAGRTVGSPTPGLFRSVAEELTTKPTTAGGRLDLSAAENMKRTLQRAAQSEYVKEGPQSLAGEAKTEIAARLRKAVEDAVAEQSSRAPGAAAAFEPVKREVGALIEASNAANRGAARAANRQTHGLGAKVMASGALAGAGAPGAVATLLAATAARNRLPATQGFFANKLAGWLQPSLPEMSPRLAGATADPLVEELLALLRGGPRVGVPVGAAEETK